jgi:hypothetical protein
VDDVDDYNWCVLKEFVRECVHNISLFLINKKNEYIYRKSS